MKVFKRIGVALLAVILAFALALLAIHIYLGDKGYDIRFPLSSVCNDDADYKLIRYGIDSACVLDDDEYIKKHKYDVVIIYPTWLDNSTGDGYFLVKKNGEIIYACAFIEGMYFDSNVSEHYTKYDTLEEYAAAEQ